MYQGQLCKIEARNDAIPLDSYNRMRGWFMRLRADETTMFYYLVDEDREGELRIDMSLVDDSLINKYPDRPYRVTCTAPVEIQVACTRVSVDIEKSASLAAVEQKVRALKTLREAKQKEVETTCAAYKQAQEQYLKLDDAVRDIDAEIRKGMNGQAMEFVYAYGKHSACGEEYCWCVPAWLKDDVKVGSTIKVATSRGESRAVVTRIEKTSAYFDHNLVLGVDED